MADIPSYPLYNRTYHLYRISPLHHGRTPLLQDKTLRGHAKRLTEQLKGDSVRGVQVDYASADDTVKLGPLEGCTWEMLGDEDTWIDHHRHSLEPGASQEPTNIRPGQVRGLQISLEYERQSYSALLLRDPDESSSIQGFTSLPLLLTKMPGSIREILINYLRISFDAHVTPLRLSSTYIISVLETYLNHLSAITSTQAIPHIIRQLHVQFACTVSTNLLKHVEIIIASMDISGFVDRGRALSARSTTPFREALRAYLRSHLALDINSPKLQVSRISCHSFHLGTDRLKLAAPEITADTSYVNSGGLSQDLSASQLAVQDLYKSLVREAAGTGKFLPDDLILSSRDDTPSSGASTGPGRRKRAMSSTTLGNEKKKTRSRGKENSRHAN